MRATPIDGDRHGTMRAGAVFVTVAAAAAWAAGLGGFTLEGGTSVGAAGTMSGSGFELVASVGSPDSGATMTGDGWSIDGGVLAGGSQSDPRLDLVVQGGGGCLAPGSQVTVALWMHDIASTGSVASGFQAFLSFDASYLSFASGAYTLAPFGLPIVPIAAVGDEIDLAAIVDVGNGQAPSSADAVLATLTFNVVGPIEACDVPAAVAFRAEILPTRLIDDGGLEIAGVSLADLDAITIDGAAPLLAVPSDIVVNADAGGCDAVIDPGFPTATDGCSPSPIVTFVRSDAKPNLTDPYDSADSPIAITWTATDACGNQSQGVQTVTVRPFNDLVVDVAFAGALATPLDRCIRFELFAADCQSSEIVDATLTFVNGAASAVIDVPCGDYACITATDPLHGLLRADTDGDFGVAGVQYVCDFTAAGASDDAILGGNLNGDDFVDILDFGVFIVAYGTNYGSGDTPCGTPAPHADVNGDGQVGVADFTYIQINFLEFAEAPCCAMMSAWERRHGRVGFNALGTTGAIRAIAVTDLGRIGLGRMARADLNHDGMVDELDLVAFAQGARP